MSADGYSACPKCVGELRVKVTDLERRATKDWRAFSSPVEWQKAQDEAKSQRKLLTELEENHYGEGSEEVTFREYYETYLTYDPPTLNYRYDAACDVCGFSHSYSVADPIKVPAAAPQGETTPDAHI